MHRWRRRAWTGAVVLVVTLCSTACAGLPSGGSGTATVPVAAAVGSDGVARVRLDHRTGDDGPAPVVTVPPGRTVELVVGSDTAQRVLVPELGQVRYVTAGGTVSVRFAPAGPGPITVELGTGEQLGRIEVGQA